MKPVSLFSVIALFAAGMAPLPAQIFRPETVTGAALGGLAGAVIGHNDGRHGWEGAAYGALAGAVIGTAVGHARDHDAYERTQVPRPRYHYPDAYAWRGSRYDRYSHGHHQWAPRVSVGFYHGDWHRRHRYGWGHAHRWHDRHWDYGWYGRSVYPRRSYRVAYPAYPVYPVYAAAEPWPVYQSSRATSGALLGGIAGAIIGHNNGRRGWEGAAYGLGAGYLLGSWADARAQREADAAAAAEAWYRASERSATPAPSAPASAPVTIINNYYASPSASGMAQANGMFGR